MSCKGNTEPRQNAGRYPTSIALRFYIWIADTKVCFCALSAARRQRPAMRPGTRCPPAPPRPIPPAISRPAAGFFVQSIPPAAGSQNDRIDFSSVIHRYLQITEYDSRIMYPYHIRFSAYKKCLSSAASGISKIILIYGCLHLVQFVTVRRASGSGRH